MSYILDALKKSEQERGHGSAPGVQTVHSSSINYHNQKKSYWPYALIIAIVLNFLAIIYFIFDKEVAVTEEVATEVNNTPIDASNKQLQEYQKEQALLVNQATIENATDKPSKLVKNTSIKTIPVPVTATQQPKSRNTVVETSPLNIISYHNLDDSIKAQLPAIIISAHVYSSNPAQRSIVINNKFLEEGEYIIDDLVLHEITAEGAILNHQGILFSYGAVSSWQ